MSPSIGVQDGRARYPTNFAPATAASGRAPVLALAGSGILKANSAVEDGFSVAVLRVPPSPIWPEMWSLPTGNWRR